MTRATLSKKQQNATHGQPAIDRLIAIMAWLRDPKFGGPWDLKQSFATIAPYTIEEAYETAEAAERGDLAALKEELGDLLLQVVFHARMAEERGAFGFTDVAAAIAEKMVKRHPHVFDQAKIGSAEAQTLAWEAQKAQERQGKRPNQPAPVRARSMALAWVCRRWRVQPSSSAAPPGSDSTGPTRLKSTRRSPKK
jgi:nucleoside triphosphate diphosphatase